VQKFYPVSETVTKDVYNNGNAGSRFDGRNNGGKQSSSSSCFPNSRNILSPNQFGRRYVLFFNCHRLFDRDQNVDNICSATLFAQEGNTFPGSDTPHFGPLSSDNGRREKSAKLASTPETDNQRTLRFQKTPAFRIHSTHHCSATIMRDRVEKLILLSCRYSRKRIAACRRFW
jgi:hypothetical protein